MAKDARVDWRQWRGPAGFLVGLILLAPLIGFTTLSITGLPPTTAIVGLVFVLAFNLYLINGFIRALCTFLAAATLAAALPSSIEFLGFIPAALVHSLYSTSQPPDSEVVAGGIAIVILMASYIRPEKSVEQGGLLTIFGALFWAVLASVSLAINGAHAVSDATVFYGYSAFSLLKFYVRARRRPNRRFIAMWTAIQPFDAKFAGYIATRLPAITLVTLAYIYIVITFAGIYYYIDNCDSANFPCSLVDYQPFLGKAPDETKCWSFNSVKPQATASTDLCANHRHAAKFTIRGFLPYLYFSMITSTTVGYGDITPLSYSAVWIVQKIAVERSCSNTLRPREGT